MTPRVSETAWELLDALREADFAKGHEDQQYARQDVTQAAEKLRKALEQSEVEPPIQLHP